MNRNSLLQLAARPTVFAAVACTTLFACGDDDGGPSGLAEPTPIALTAANRGVTYEPQLGLGSVAESPLAADLELAERAVIVEQVYSEFRHQNVGNAPRASEPRFDSVMEATYDDTDLAATLDAPAHTYWVVDLQRLDRGWLVDWNGLERDTAESGPSALTFSLRAADHDSDYQDAVITRVSAAFEAADPRPDSVIIGYEMERHYLAASADWPSYAAFVSDLAAALRAIEPSVRIGAGINWSRFMDQVVPLFVGAAGQDAVNYAAVRAAWEGVLDPLYVRGEGSAATTVLDFYAFAAIPDTERYPSPSALPENHFSGVATYMNNNPRKALPVAWFAVGWPVASQSSGFFGDYWAFFAEHAGGADTELIAWWGYSHLGSSLCRVAGNAEAPPAYCNRGMYTSSGSPVPGLRDPFFQ